MKNKILFTAMMYSGTFFLSLQNIQAQTLIGGSVHWLRHKEDGIPIDDGEVIYSELSIAPRVGFYQKKFIYGIDALVGKNQTSYFNPKTMMENKTTYQTSALSAFGRYVHKTNDWLGLWVELKSGLQYGRLSYGPLRHFRAILLLKKVI